MRYLNGDDIEKIGIDWEESINRIIETVKLINDNDYSQPIKPYLRYRKMENRIIAMPAFVGGTVNLAGIKWIASFPQNIHQGKPRANSVIVLNKAETGEVVAVLNTTRLSMIRTASVTGVVLSEYLKRNFKESYKIGIIGFGPIGQHHLSMCEQVMKEKITDIYIYDKYRKITEDMIHLNEGETLHIKDRWEEIFNEVDILLTCTASKDRYISGSVRKGFLALHVSLRDYNLDTLKQFDKPVYTDDWEEVNRENTDIEYMYKNNLIKKNESLSICDIVCNKAFDNLEASSKVLFAPMGMASFDIAIGGLYMGKALKAGVGTELE